MYIYRGSGASRTRTELAKLGIHTCMVGLFDYEQELKKTIAAGATDNCAKNPDMKFEPSDLTKKLDLTGPNNEYLFEVTVTDPSGNEATHKTQVKVTDDEKPTFGDHCPKGVTMKLTGDRLETLHQAKVRAVGPPPLTAFLTFISRQI